MHFWFHPIKSKSLLECLVHMNFSVRKINKCFNYWHRFEAKEKRRVSFFCCYLHAVITCFRWANRQFLLSPVVNPFSIDATNNSQLNWNKKTNKNHIHREVVAVQFIGKWQFRLNNIDKLEVSKRHIVCNVFS